MSVAQDIIAGGGGWGLEAGGVAIAKEVGDPLSGLIVSIYLVDFHQKRVYKVKR